MHGFAMLYYTTLGLQLLYIIIMLHHAYKINENLPTRTTDKNQILILYKFRTDGLMHWEKETPPTPPIWYYRAPAADIEMTAYALLTYVVLAEDDSSLISQAMPIVKWLTKQRNALGGFASTQVSKTLET